MMAMKVWAGACFMTCLCVLGPAAAQEPAATRCPPATSVAGGQQEAGAAAADHARQQACAETRSDVSDADKALAIALLGCAIAFGSHVARRRSAKVVLS
jgi:hypothetical protein